MAWPDSRPVGYTETDVFDEKANDWTSTLTDLETSGGEKYKPQLVLVSDQAKIYFSGA